MTQVTVEDYIHRVEGNTTLVGINELDTAVDLCAKKHHTFTTDDVWKYAPNYTGNKKALAGALGRAVKNKLITHMGFTKSTSRTRHNGITSQYMSNQYRGF
jgi:hypothetical protein